MALLIFLIILSILVVAHEFGHFIAAKKAKVRVEVFSIGFGRKLISRKKGDTEYAISMLPFGGYVKMAGDNAQEAKGAPDEFLGAPASKRFWIVFLGPLFNYVLGVLCFWIVFMSGYPRLLPTVGTVLEGMGAQEVGIAAGDTITAIDNTPVRWWDDLQKQVYRRRSGDTVRVSVNRKGQLLIFDVPLKQKTVTSEIGRKRTMGLLGITPSGDTSIEKAGIVGAFFLSLRRSYELTVLTYQALWAMITGQLSVRDSVTGPLGMFVITSEISKLGIPALLSFIAVLSISLGIFNLLPLPALDGGHIALLAIEKIRRRPLSKKAEDIFNQIGFGFLITLAVLVFVNDLARFGYFQKAQGIYNKIFNK